MAETLTSDQIDGYVRLALESPGDELLRRYFKVCADSVPLETAPITESEKSWVVANLESNPSWQHQWRLLENEIGRTVEWQQYAAQQAAAHVRPKDRPSRGSARVRNVGRVLFSTLMLYALLWVGGRATLPSTYYLASLDEYDNHLERQTRSIETDVQSDFAEAAKALLAAPDNTFGLFPRYNRTDVERAIEYLNDAYRESRDPFERAEIAFFMAKAHFMEGDRTNARLWLAEVDSQQVADYRSDAAELLRKMENVSRD